SAKLALARPNIVVYSERLRRTVLLSLLRTTMSDFSTEARTPRIRSGSAFWAQAGMPASGATITATITPQRPNWRRFMGVSLRVLPREGTSRRSFGAIGVRPGDPGAARRRGSAGPT